MILAVFGSSKGGIPRWTVQGYLEKRFNRDVTLISGGAPEVDTFAEQTWQQLGGDTVSLRPVKTRDGSAWTIELWDMPAGGAPTVSIPPNALEWADWTSAARWRSMMIAQRAERGVAFVRGFSSGSRFTIDWLHGLGKPVSVHES